MVEAAFARGIAIVVVDPKSFLIGLLFTSDFASFVFAENGASMEITFGVTVSDELFASGEISFLIFVAPAGILIPSNFVSLVWLGPGALIVLVERWTTLEEFLTAVEVFVLGAAFLEAFVGAGGSGLIFNSESGSTPTPIGLCAMILQIGEARLDLPDMVDEILEHIHHVRRNIVEGDGRITAASSSIGLRRIFRIFQH